VQVDGIKTRVESAPGVYKQRLKLKYDEMLSNFAVTLSLRHYIMAEDYGGWSGGAPDLLLWPSAVLAAAAAAATAASVKAVKAVELGRRRLTALNSVLKASMV
jgi:hypothetical protein